MEITATINVNLDGLSLWRINQIGLVNSSQRIKKQAQENAPYATGTLKKSIGVEPGNITTKSTETRIGPRKVVYAIRREFENKKNPDRKFYMKRAYMKAEDIVKEEFENAVAIVIKRL